jgi:aarF domain-containing kinase
MCIIIGQTIDARLEVDERETTQLVLEIVNVAEKNGLKLPREFGLILKQVLPLPQMFL